MLEDWDCESSKGFGGCGCHGKISITRGDFSLATGCNLECSGKKYPTINSSAPCRPNDASHVQPAKRRCLCIRSFIADVTVHSLPFFAQLTNYFASTLTRRVILANKVHRYRQLAARKCAKSRKPPHFKSHFVETNRLNRSCVDLLVGL